MDFYGMNDTLRKSYPERTHYSRTERTVNGVPSEISKFTNNDILSSSAWSSVVHQPSQDSEPEDLPSTVDIDAIKEPLTPVNSVTGHLHISSNSITISDNLAESGESYSDTDSESDNSDNKAENAASEVNSSSCSDSDSLSSRLSSSNSPIKLQSNHSSRSNSPASNCEDGRQQFSVQENNFEQGGLKLKLSALKVSKFDQRVQNDVADYSSESAESRFLATKKRSNQNVLIKSQRRYSLKKRNERNKISKHKHNKCIFHQRSDDESSSSNSVSLEINNQRNDFDLLRHSSKFNPVSSQHKSIPENKNHIKDNIAGGLKNNDSLLYRSLVKLPQTCKLSEDSEDDEDIQTKKISPLASEEFCRYFNQNNDLEIRNEDEKSEAIPIAEHLKKKNSKFIKQKSEGDLSDSSSDAEMLPKQIVSDAIKSICVDSDSCNDCSDESHTKVKFSRFGSSAEKKKSKALYSSNLLEVFAEQTDQLNKSYTGDELEFEKTTKPVARNVKGNEKKKRCDILRKSDRPLKYKGPTSKAAALYVKVDGAISNVSPDSGIQSNSGSPLYHNLHSPATSHPKLLSQTFSGKLNLAVDSSKFSNLNHKPLLAICTKNSYEEPNSNKLKSVDSNQSTKMYAAASAFRGTCSSYSRMKTHKTNGAYQSDNFDETLKVPPYFGFNIAANVPNTLPLLNSNLTLFQEKRGPGRPKKQKSSTVCAKFSCKGRTAKKMPGDYIRKFKTHQNSEKCGKYRKKNTKENKMSFNYSNVNNTNGLRKNKKHKKIITKTRLINVELLKEIENLSLLFDTKCVLDNMILGNGANFQSTSISSKILNRKERSKKRMVSDKDSETETNSVMPVVPSNDLKTKRRHKKNAVEVPKVPETNRDQRLPLKKRHYHISATPSANQTQTETKIRVEKFPSFKDVEERMDMTTLQNNPIVTKLNENHKSKSEISKTILTVEATNHTKRDTRKFSSKNESTELLRKFELSSKNEIAKFTTKLEDDENTDEIPIKKLFSCDSAQSSNATPEDGPITFRRKPKVFDPEEYRSLGTLPLRRSNRNANLLSSACKSSNKENKTKLNTTIADKVKESVSCSRERNAKKNAKQNILDLIKRKDILKGKVRNKKTSTTENDSRCLQKDPTKSSPKKMKLLITNTIVNEGPSETAKIKKDALVTINNTRQSAVKFDDLMNVPPILSSVEKEKPIFRVKSSDTDSPPILDDFRINNQCKSNEVIPCSVPSIVKTSSVSQLTTTISCDNTSDINFPPLDPPTGIFEPTRKFIPELLSKPKKYSIDDVLSKLKEKLRKLEPPLKIAPTLIEKISNATTDSQGRILRPKRSCAEQENTVTKKARMCKDITICVPKLASSEVETQSSDNKLETLDVTLSKELKPKLKRRKTNRTGFPIHKKKKKMKALEQLWLDSGNFDSDKNLSLQSTEVQDSNYNAHPVLTTEVFKILNESSILVCNDSSQTVKARSFLNAVVHGQNGSTSMKTLRRKMNVKCDLVDEKIIERNISDSLPNRSSARISLIQQTRTVESKKLLHEGKNDILNNKELLSKMKLNNTISCKKNNMNVSENRNHNEKEKKKESKKKLEKVKSVVNDNTLQIVDADQGDSDVSIEDVAPKKKCEGMPAGLFSNYYKEECGSSTTETKSRIPYKAEEHVHGLLPQPPYFEVWVRRRLVDFKLPYDLWWLHSRCKLPGRQLLESWKYKKIKMNVYNDLKPPKVYETQTCNCRVPEDKNQLGCGEDCINRMLYAECSPDLCPLRNRCSNQRIQKYNVNDMKLSKFMTKDKGIGMKTEKRIKSGEYIIEYVGEVRTDKEFKNLMTTLYKNDIHHYCLNLEGGLVIDAHRMGSDARFVNHSCEPNCEIQKWNVNGLFRMALFARSDIEPGTELTYDYNFALFNPKEGQLCHCGSTKCRGVIGGRSQRVSVQMISGESIVDSVCRINIPCEAPYISSRKAKLRPRKHVYKSLSTNNVIKRKLNSEANNLSENVWFTCNKYSFIPPTPEPLPLEEKYVVSKSRLFVLRNLTKVTKVRDKLRQIRKDEKHNVKIEKTRQSADFSKLFNALSNQRVMKTRGVAQAEEDPEITRIVKFVNIFKTIFNYVVSAKDEKDGKSFSSLFKALPSKEKFPTYYQMIEDPIDLNTIEKNIASGVYKDTESFDKDMKALISNNIKYFGRTSERGIAAVRLRKEFNVAKLNHIPQLEAVLGHAVPRSFKPVPGDEDEGIIRCICGRSIEEGEMILCDRCLVWQHCSCVRVDPKVEQYHCERCIPREVDYEVPLPADIPLPDYPAPDEKHYVTLMRDDLQIRLGDAVYILRHIPNPTTGSIHTFRTIGDFRFEDCDILRVEQLWITEKGEKFAFGHLYLRPCETYHEPTRRFFPNEVVKIVLHEQVSLDLIMGRCYVFDLKTYCKGKPVDSDPDHIYICEYKVDKHAKSFFKLSKSKAGCSVPTMIYAFEQYETRLKPSRTYAPHGDTRPQLKSRSKKFREINDRCTKNSNVGKPGNFKVKTDKSVVYISDSKLQVERQKQRLNTILLKLLSKKPTKAPLDVSYLLDIGRRHRTKSTLTDAK